MEIKPLVEVSRAASPPTNISPIDTSAHLGVVHCLWYCVSTVGILLAVAGFELSIKIRFWDLAHEPVIGTLIILFQQFLMWHLYSRKRYSPYRCVGGFAKSVRFCKICG
ncbi:hypothetical protein ACH5RR_037786 [Cinchona calisaya]|uniref:Uncharacterized protein n=1 Tax=Cinchona calisaya TaxID=153742 RepID=A0ABD2Y779_9GENT